MPRWIDGPDWHRLKGLQLAALLGDEYRDNAEIEPLLDICGVGRGEVPTIDVPRVKWLAFGKSLQSMGKLGCVIDAVAADRTALAATLADLCEAEPSIAPIGNPVDPFEARLLRGSRRPMINRQDLRSNLRRFFSTDSRDRLKVLTVRGPGRCGKSFSFELMKHIACDRSDLKLIHIDFSTAALGNRAVDLMNMICGRLKMPDLVDTPPGPESSAPPNGDTADDRDETTQTRFAVNLVNKFVGVYEPLDGATRVLVIDGLNRVNLKSEVGHLVAALAVQVVRDQLPDTQLVLMGWDGTFDQGLAFDVLNEDISEITPAHVRLFFEGLVSDDPLNPDELDKIVGEAMTGAAELDVLERQVREVALRLVGAP
ncbi:hypothetical protein [Mycolicibacterium cosmeticum]|uniref:hypothetical protein n=1 Tax=Mycolicibacterium cosmeticum TaxID=258533 RepID=UPI003204C20F